LVRQASEAQGSRERIRLDPSQGLGLRQFQLELVTQERCDLGLDLLGLAPGTGEPQQPIVGLCRVPDYAEWQMNLQVRGLVLAAGAA